MGSVARGPVGTVGPYAEQSRGRLRWRRWDRTRDHLWLWTIVTASSRTRWCPTRPLTKSPERDQGRYSHYGETVAVSPKRRALRQAGAVPPGLSSQLQPGVDGRRFRA